MGMVYTPARAARPDCDSRKPSCSPGEGQQEGGQDGNQVAVMLSRAPGGIQHSDPTPSQGEPCLMETTIALCCLCRGCCRTHYVRLDRRLPRSLVAAQAKAAMTPPVLGTRDSSNRTDGKYPATKWTQDRRTETIGYIACILHPQHTGHHVESSLILHLQIGGPGKLLSPPQ